MIFSKLSELKNLSREELEKQAGIAIWLLINEVAATKNGEFETAPLQDLTFDNEPLELELNSENLKPNESTILRFIKNV